MKSLILIIALSAPVRAQILGGVGYSEDPVSLIQGATLQFTAPVTFLGAVNLAGGTTVSANAPILGDGSSGDPLRLDTSSATLQGNTFNGANQLVQLDGTGLLPALDGSQLINVASTILQRTKAQLEADACATHPSTQCLRHNTTDFDLYTSTGSGAGDWRNVRTGHGPGELP